MLFSTITQFIYFPLIFFSLDVFSKAIDSELKKKFSNRKESGAFYNFFDMDKSSFSKDDLSRRYRRLARMYHPDKNKEDGANDIFTAITEAFDVLSDEKKKTIYDRGGIEAIDRENGASGASGSGGDSFANDILSQMFGNAFGGGGGGSGGHYHNVRRSPSIQHEFEVTLEQLYKGDSITIDWDRQIICTHCEGDGAESSKHISLCSQCEGRGSVIRVQQVMPGFLQQVQTTCDACHGEGKVIKRKCHLCKGNRIIEKASKLEFSIPAGSPSKAVFKFEGQSHEQPGMKAGDVIIILKEQPHTTYKRDGDNLYLNTTISLRDALLGFKKKIGRLDNESSFTLSRRDTVTQPSFVQVVPGEGMKKIDGSTGDLFVTYQVILPARLSSVQKENLSKILDKTEADSKDEL